MSDDDIGDTEFGLQVGIGFVGKAATALVGLGGSVLLARVLGPGSYGLFYVTLAIAQFLENPISGWAAACKKRMTETDFDESEAVGSVFLVIVITALILGPLAYVGLGAIASNPITPIAVPILFVPMATYWSLSKVLSGRENFSMSVWSGVFSNFAQMTLMIIFVLLGLEIWGMVYGTALGAAIGIPAVYRWIGVRPTVPSRAALGSIWGFARWSIPRGFVGTALERMDVILLGWLVTAGIAGKYQVALQLSMPAIFVSSVIGAGLVGRVSNLESRKREWVSDLRNSLSFGSILAVPIFFGSLALGEELVTTAFGGEYAGGGIFLVGLSAYRLLSTQLQPWESVISGLDRPRVSFVIALVSFVLNVTLGIGLWLQFGALGIVGATVVAAALGYAARVIFIHRITSVNFILPRPFLEQTGAAIIMVIVIYPTKLVIGGGYGWFHLALLLGLGGFIYMSILIGISERLRVTFLGVLDDFYEEFPTR